jgi:hypothetical protein
MVDRDLQLQSESGVVLQPFVPLNYQCFDFDLMLYSYQVGLDTGKFSI